jgi:hypothetical protein
VVYGHPFETPEAEETYADVESFYTGRMGLGQADGFLEHYAVELVLVQTDRYPAPSLPVAVYPIFQTGPVVVYRRGP